MYKKIVFIGALLAGSSTGAMEFTQEADESQVKIYVGEEQDAITLPIRYAKLIGALELVDAPIFNDDGFHLPKITLQAWKLIEAHLERLYGIIANIANIDNIDMLMQEILAAFGTLEGKDLIEVIRATDYLNLPILLEIACEVINRGAPGKISPEDIASLPSHLSNPLILHKIVTLVGLMAARQLAQCQGHTDCVRSVCVTKDGTIVSGSDDKTVRLWDMQGKELAVCRGHERSVTSVCVAKDGKIVSGSSDGTVRVWNMQGEQLEVWKHKGAVVSVCVTKDGKTVSGSWDGTVRVWNMQGNEPVVFRGHEDVVSSLCVTNNGEIVSGSCDGTVRVWNMQGNEAVVFRGHGHAVSSVCVMKGGKIVSSVSDDTTARMWNMKGNELAVFRHEGVFPVCVTKEGKVVSGALFGTMGVWDMQGNQLAICRGHTDRVNSVCVTKDGKLVSGSGDNTVCVWDISLLDRISGMDEVQAEAVWTLLQRIAQHGGEIDKQKFWQEIEKIVEEELPVVTAPNNNLNNDNNI